MADLRSGVSLMALRRAMPPRDLEREATLTSHATVAAELLRGMVADRLRECMTETKSNG